MNYFKYRNFLNILLLILSLTLNCWGEDSLSQNNLLSNKLIFVREKNPAIAQSLESSWLTVVHYMNGSKLKLPDNSLPWLKLVPDGNTSAGLSEWINARISYFLPQEFYVTSGNDFKFNSTANLYMLNVASLSWFRENALDSKPYLLLNNTPLILNSPSDGLILLGQALNVNENPFLLMKIMVHESRHSDCSHNPTTVDLQNFKDENHINKIQNCGYFHSPCPEGHDLEGLYACDDHIIGGYATEAFFLDYLLKLCNQNRDCSFQQKAVLKGLFIESKGRVQGWDQILNQQIDRSQVLMSDGIKNNINLKKQIQNAIYLSDESNGLEVHNFKTTDLQIETSKTKTSNPESTSGSIASSPTSIESILKEELQNLLIEVLQKEITNYHLPYPVKKNLNLNNFSLFPNAPHFVTMNKFNFHDVIVRGVPTLNLWWNSSLTDNRDYIHSKISIETQIFIAQLKSWIYSLNNKNQHILNELLEEAVNQLPYFFKLNIPITKITSNIQLSSIPDKLFNQILNKCIEEVKNPASNNTKLPQLVGELCESWK